MAQVGGCVGAHCRVLTQGIKNFIGKAGGDECQGDEKGSEDEPPAIQIDATEAEIIGSEGLRGQGLLGSVEPYHEREHHQVACRDA